MYWILAVFFFIIPIFYLFNDTWILDLGKPKIHITEILNDIKYIDWNIKIWFNLGQDKIEQSS